MGSRADMHMTRSAGVCEAGSKMALWRVHLVLFVACVAARENYDVSYRFHKVWCYAVRCVYDLSLETLDAACHDAAREPWTPPANFRNRKKGSSGGSQIMNVQYWLCVRARVRAGRAIWLDHALHCRCTSCQVTMNLFHRPHLGDQNQILHCEEIRRIFTCMFHHW